MKIAFLFGEILSLFVVIIQVQATAGGGEWSGWTSWSECKGSYGEEVTINRTRSCINQSSTNGTCPGDATESKKCKPVTCQGAPPIKYVPVNDEDCVFPLVYSGNVYCDCVDNSWCATKTDVNHEFLDYVYCKSVVVDGQWSDWSAWSNCQGSFRKEGRKNRTRTCTNPAPQNGGNNCSGDASEANQCQPITCQGAPPIKYTSVNDEDCVFPLVYSGRVYCDCVDDSWCATKTDENHEFLDYVYCKSVVVDGEWSEWSSWSQCEEQSDGKLMKNRTRSCTNPAPVNGGSNCSGVSEEHGSCAPGAVNGGWSDWTSWTDCEGLFGQDGSQNRTRACSNPAPAKGGSNCSGNTDEFQTCIPVTCKGAPSEKYTSVTDDHCVYPLVYSGQVYCDCVGGFWCATSTNDDHEFETWDYCKSIAVDGEWSEWTSWTECEGKYGQEGKQNRTRACSNPAPARGGEPCLGDDTEWKACTPVTCEEAPPTKYISSTNETCVYPLVYSGQVYCDCVGEDWCATSTNDDHEVISWNYCKKIAVDGGWSEWTSWTDCEGLYGEEGIQNRTRSCTNPAPLKGGAQCEGDASETQTCVPVTCDGAPVVKYGTKSSQPCVFPLWYHGRTYCDCVGDNWCATSTDDDHEYISWEYCSAIAIDGEWSAWTSWSECEGTYGKNGTKERRRSCTNPAPAKGGMDCTGDSIETSTCSPMTCEGAPAAKYTSSTEYPCVYPLSYGGDVYCDCIQGITEVWCATSTDSNNEYVSWNSCKEAGSE